MCEKACSEADFPAFSCANAVSMCLQIRAICGGMKGTGFARLHGGREGYRLRRGASSSGSQQRDGYARYDGRASGEALGPSHDSTNAS